MPTSFLGDGASAPASRSFAFANLASEGVAGVEVYKSGRAAIASGGIGSSINIRTPRPFDRPGLRGSISAKAVLDSSRNQRSEERRVGKECAVRVDLGGRRIIKKNTKRKTTEKNRTRTHH